MEKKSMGSFISALRRAKGYTQKEMAEKLNVSDKAVSRWERDECAPDITILPVLAELLGVTCDELIKGERILNAEEKEMSEIKTQKNINTLLGRSIADFKCLLALCIGMCIFAVGLMLLVSYGLHKPLIGFLGLIIMNAINATFLYQDVIRVKYTRNSEVFENATEDMKQEFCLSLKGYIITAIVIMILGMILSILLLLF